MMGEKVLTMGIAMVVSIFIARHLGPEGYGILSYAISIVSLFAIATHMGLHGLAIRELVKFPEKEKVLLGSIFGIKFIGALIALIAFCVFIYSTSNSYDLEFYVLLAVSGTILFKPFEVFDFWFQAKVQAKYSSIVRATAIIAISIIQIGLVVIGAQVLMFAFAYLLQAIFIAILFLVFFKKKTRKIISQWKFSFKKVGELLSQGWMIMLGAIFAMVYLKIDQIMIRWIVNAEEVGIYSVAAKLSEAWYFIPSIIVASLFPKLIELREKDSIKFNERLQQLFDLLFLIAIVIAILFTFISEPLINFLYGREFQGAGLILSIHIWAAIFIFMRAVFSKWILIEDAIVFSMITQGCGAVTNVILNLILIPKFGGLGAAIATIISYAMASYLILLFYKKSRPIFWMMSKSIVFPIRITYNYFKR